MLKYLQDRFDKFVSITQWPLRLRRAFIISMPISVPLWFLIIGGWFLFIVTLVILSTPILIAQGLWKE